MKNKLAVILSGIMIFSSALTGCSTSSDTGSETAAESSAEAETSEEIADESSVEAETESVDEIAEAALSTVYPLTVETKGSDFEPVEQTYESAPERVVTCNASSVEMLYNLGLGDKIAAAIEIDNSPGEEWAELYESLEKLGDKTTVSKEVIAAAEPDMIIGRSNTFVDTTFGSISELNDLGINVYAQKASDMGDSDVSMQSIIDDVIELGVIFDVQETANAYAETLSERLDTVLETVSDKVDDSSEPLRVLIMASYNEGTFTAFGANTKLQSGMLEALNCVNVFDSGQSSLTSENLVEANPDIIIYIKADRNATTDATAVESLMADETLSSVPAIMNEKIIEIEYNAFMDYGVRNFDTLEELAAYIYE